MTSKTFHSIMSVHPLSIWCLCRILRTKFRACPKTTFTKSFQSALLTAPCLCGRRDISTAVLAENELWHPWDHPGSLKPHCLIASLSTTVFFFFCATGINCPDVVACVAVGNHEFLCWSIFGDAVMQFVLHEQVGKKKAEGFCQRA